MPHIVGRQAELAQLNERLEATRSGCPCVLVVEGEPGIGKTSLVLRFLHDVQDVRVLHAAGEEFEAALAFGVVDQLFRDFELSGDRPLQGQPLEPGRADVLAVGAEILDALSMYQREQPVILFIDDVHWGDPASLHAIAFVLRRLRAGSACSHYSRVGIRPRSAYPRVCNGWLRPDRESDSISVDWSLGSFGCWRRRWGPVQCRRGLPPDCATHTRGTRRPCPCPARGAPIRGAARRTSPARAAFVRHARNGASRPLYARCRTPGRCDRGTGWSLSDRSGRSARRDRGLVGCTRRSDCGASAR